MKRAVVTLLTTCGAGLALGPATAWGEGETVVTYKGSPSSGSEISVVAAAGRQNAFEWRAGAVHVEIRDSAGVTESSPHCTRPSPTEVVCQAQGLRRLTGNTGDMGDAFTLDGKGTDVNVEEVELFMGPGHDSAQLAWATFPQANEGVKSLLLGGTGRDRLRLSGRGTIRGGASDDRLCGGRGPQRIFGGAGNDLLSGGKGFDICRGGSGNDRGGRGCEKIFSISEGIQCVA